jgi:uncharacterized repeat protein (TIGR04138 family)
MQKPNFAEAIVEIVGKDPRFDRDAYLFVREGLDFTVKMLKKPAQGPPMHRHVSGQELLDGLRRYALEQFGPMSKTVLAHWGVKQCEDFGDIVFNMVEKGILGKTDQDRREDFKGGYDFEDAFVRPFQPEQPRRVRRARGTARNDRLRDKSLKPGSETLSSGSN